MRTHVPGIKAVVALIIVLCIAMPFLFSIAAASIMSTHTHICHYEEYKDVCVDARECCKICTNFYEVKYRSQPLYGNVANKSLYTASLLINFSSESASLYANAMTLVSLKVRLNN